MRSLQNIMVVIEPKELRQPALERGLALYNYAKAHALKTGEKIKTILMPIPLNRI